MVQFSLDKWLNKDPSLHMVRKQTCEIGKGTLGIMYNYQPVVPTANGLKPVKPNDWIKRLDDGDYVVNP